MSKDNGFASINGHLIGILFKELVRRAINAIRAERFKFEAYEKQTEGKDYDIFTSADTAAQNVYVRSLRECLPEFGIVAEEADLIVPCTHPKLNIYVTVDPLDGTRAFARRQSFGVATMIALVCDGDVIAAYVGDVMTQEIFGFRPDSRNTHRISEYDKAEVLQINPELPLHDQYLLIRDHPSLYSAQLQPLLRRGKDNGLFKDIEVVGGSIGAGMARLWKGEVGGTILRAQNETPWDSSPIIGISQHLGFVFLRINPNTGTLEEYTPTLSSKIYRRDHETIIVHRSQMETLRSFLQASSRT